MSDNRNEHIRAVDYLLFSAVEAERRGLPYASQFREMIQVFAAAEDVPVPETTAQRSLMDHEAGPVAVILGAYGAASDTGDLDALRDVVDAGLTLLAKWPAYLADTGWQPQDRG